MKVAALAVLLLPSIALAEPSSEERLALLLTAHHGLPSRAAIERRIPNAKELLIATADRREVLPFYRARAVDALAAWPGDLDVRALYSRLLAEGDRALSARVLMRVPEVFGPLAAGVLAPYRDHPDPVLRRAAIPKRAAGFRR
jgi:hypothetical protein